jgi:hypothetical protein
VVFVDPGCVEILELAQPGGDLGGEIVAHT